MGLELPECQYKGLHAVWHDASGTTLPAGVLVFGAAWSNVSGLHLIILLLHSIGSNQPLSWRCNWREGPHAYINPDQNESKLGVTKICDHSCSNSYQQMIRSGFKHTTASVNKALQTVFLRAESPNNVTDKSTFATSTMTRGMMQ